MTSALAAEIVREANRRRESSSYSEFRSRAAAGASFADSRDLSFWRYVTAPTELGLPQVEHRVLSKATSSGGFLVPQDFDDQITSARRARNVIGELARTIETEHGRAARFRQRARTASAHGRPRTRRTPLPTK